MPRFTHSLCLDCPTAHATSPQTTLTHVLLGVPPAHTLPPSHHRPPALGYPQTSKSSLQGAFAGGRASQVCFPPYPAANTIPGEVVRVQRHRTNRGVCACLHTHGRSSDRPMFVSHWHVRFWRLTRPSPAEEWRAGTRAQVSWQESSAKSCAQHCHKDSLRSQRAGETPPTLEDKAFRRVANLWCQDPGADSSSGQGCVGPSAAVHNPPNPSPVSDGSAVQG